MISGSFPERMLSMFRRFLCVCCTVLLLLGSMGCAAAESAPAGTCYDFDLVFSLNAEAFPKLQRTRARGYAELLDRLGLRGSLAWNNENGSFDLDTTLYYRDKPSLTYPVHVFGGTSRLYISSPMIGNQELLLNMAALMEFAVKAKETLGLPLPYVAFLYPYVTEAAFYGLKTEWDSVIGSFSKNGTVSVDQLRSVSEFWATDLQENKHLVRWINALADGSSAPQAVWAEFENLSYYWEQVSGGKPLTVTADGTSEIWTNSAGDILFSRKSSESGTDVSMSLPATQNHYVPSFSWSSSGDGSSVSFRLSASVIRTETGDASAQDASGADAGEYTGEDEEGYSEAYDGEYEEYYEEEYDEEYDEEYEEEYGGEYGQAEAPETLLRCVVTGNGLPVSLPADASFSLDTLIDGAVYPNYSFVLRGETKKSGEVSLSLFKPTTGDAEPAAIFNCSGTVRPSEAREVQDYLSKDFVGTFNVFSFNEERLSAFTDLVIPPLVKSVFAFIEEAPTSACQSFLDDLTDMGILSMLLN